MQIMLARQTEQICTHLQTMHSAEYVRQNEQNRVHMHNLLGVFCMLVLHRDQNRAAMQAQVSALVLLPGECCVGDMLLFCRHNFCLSYGSLLWVDDDGIVCAKQNREWMAHICSLLWASIPAGWVWLGWDMGFEMSAAGGMVLEVRPNCVRPETRDLFSEFDAHRWYRSTSKTAH